MSPRRPGPAARALAACVAAALAAACNMPFEREGFHSDYELPGPDPTSTPGIDRNAPALTEENVVEIDRVAGRVLVRLAGERGSRNLEYWKPQIQVGPLGVLQTGPNAVARVSFPDDTKVIVQNTALARVGDPARKDPCLRFERLTHVEWNLPAEPKCGPLELPGGTTISPAANARVKVRLQRDRDFQVWNDGKVSIELDHEGRHVLLRPAERVDLPILRDARAEAPR